MVSLNNQAENAMPAKLTERKRTRDDIILFCCQCGLFGNAALSGGRCTLCSHPTCGNCTFKCTDFPRISKRHRHQRTLDLAKKSFFEAKSVIDAELSALKTLSHGIEPDSTAPPQLRTWLRADSPEIDQGDHRTSPTLSPASEASQETSLAHD
jgi:hypothetical protein